MARCALRGERYQPDIVDEFNFAPWPWDRDPPRFIYEGPLAALYNEPAKIIAVDDPTAFLGPESARYRLDDL